MARHLTRVGELWERKAGDLRCWTGTVAGRPVLVIKTGSRHRRYPTHEIYNYPQATEPTRPATTVTPRVEEISW